jgi:hypothetical protein
MASQALVPRPRYVPVDLLDRESVGYDLTNLAHLPPCVIECSALAGVVTGDPVVATITPFILCSHDQTRCAAESVWQ